MEDSIINHIEKRLDTIVSNSVLLDSSCSYLGPIYYTNDKEQFQTVDNLVGDENFKYILQLHLLKKCEPFKGTLDITIDSIMVEEYKELKKYVCIMKMTCSINIKEK